MIEPEPRVAAFPDPPAATGGATLATFALAALGDLLPPNAAEAGAEASYLLARVDDARTAGGPGADGLRRCLARPAPTDAPLAGLAATLELDPAETLAVALAAAVEEDPLAGRAVAHLQGDAATSRPKLGLLCAAFGGPGADPGLLRRLAGGAAVGSGLLELTGRERPLSEQWVRLPHHLYFALRGADGSPGGATIGLDGSLPVALPSSTLEAARRHAAGLAASRRLLAVRTASRPEARAIAEAVAGILGLRPVFLADDPPPGLGPWLLLRRLLPVFTFDLAPAERRSLPPVPFYHGPILALLGPDGAIETGGATALEWSVPVPPRDEREALWRISLGEPELAADLARDHRHRPGRIADLGRLARHRGGLRGRQRPSRDDVAAAAASGQGVGLEALAQHLPDPVADEALILTPPLERELDRLLLRCRAREDLVRPLGASARARYQPGVKTLFVGSSGTGKTLAASWLATRLAMPLYRVDLASVTSKYIGETEKNLANLLARAEEAGAMLLFDEADSLFGKRTEIRDSNDRFANAQTNYLLQRIESFDSVAVLTSNSRARFDAAFTRRLDTIVEFPVPGPEERRLLWRSHLGDGHDLSPRQINRLAAAADLCGGNIRNVVLTAAALAYGDSAPVGWRHVATALAGEYRKLGKQAPAELGDGDR